MLDMAVKAALILAEPSRLGFLALGVVLGLVIGVIPGIGGLVGLSLLLPFTYNMDPYAALALMMGLSAVTVTSDSIPAVLFGVPGTVGGAATILDGHPMAKQGQASRAFGATFTASVMGGLFGAAILAVSVPVLRPVMLAIGTPEMLAIVILGLSLVAALSGGTALKGVVAACLGLLAATIGEEPQSGELRWTFDAVYLFDGLPIVPVALGLFAIPELAELAIARTSIAGTERAGSRWAQLEGVRDALRSWFLVLRCSAIGSALGAIPGIGAAVIDWIAYGHAARTEKGAAETFGRGDVRGVIASESSNNAKEGGALIPTVAFGVPGSASMTLLLGAFLIQGIQPGPKMLTSQLDITYTLVWSLALANILGAGICFLFAGPLGQIARIRSGVLVPVILAVTFVGAFQGSRDWGDLYVLMSFGALGFLMKRMGWPRPPLVLGFVLGGFLENYFFISESRYGPAWLLRPAVMIILAIALLGLLRPAVAALVRRWREGASGPRFELRPTFGWDGALALGLAFLFGLDLYASSGWVFSARLVPQTIGWTGLACALLVLAFSSVHVRTRGGAPAATMDVPSASAELDRATVVKRALVYFGACVAWLVLAHLVGLLPALFPFLVAYLRFSARESWKLTAVISVSVWLACYGLFHTILVVPWPQSELGALVPEFRNFRALTIF